MSDPQDTSVSIIIRCYNEAAHIGRLLTGIDRQTFAPSQIIVVDSGSTDETLAIASQFQVEVIHIEPEDFSFGYALNIGCEAATGDVLLFASAHVYPVRNDWVAEMLRPFQSEQTGLVYGRQIGHENSRFSERQIFSQWFPDHSNPVQTHYFCNNANAAIRRSLWRQMRYNEALTGLEDLDMARRVQDAGFHVAYQAAATIVHVHEETFAQTFNRYRREAFALAHILPEERFSFFDFLRLWPGNVLSDYWHAFRQRELTRNILPIAIFRLMQFWGTYRGSNSKGSVTAELRQRFYYPKISGASSQASTPADDPALIDYTSESGRAKTHIERK